MEGNVKIMTVMGDAAMDGLSDRGSTPLRLHVKPQCTLGFLFLYSILCCKRFEACWDE